MFSIQNLHQIEITSFCNLRCKYCPQFPKLPREKSHMSDDHFAHALRWVQYFRSQGWQDSLNLAGIGESTIHPQFRDFVKLARMLLPQPFQLVLATNGVNMTPDLAKHLADNGVTVYVSLHRPEKAGLAVNMLGEAGCLAGVSADPSVSATDWAGQVKWPVSVKRGRKCPWVTGGWAIVLSDGSLSRCAYDATGVGVFGHITENVMKYATSPYVLCKTCDQDVGVPINA